jgi:hypothetical protein
MLLLRQARLRIALRNKSKVICSAVDMTRRGPRALRFLGLPEHYSRDQKE